MKHQKTNNLIKKTGHGNYREFPKTKYEWLKKITHLGAISMSTFNLFLMF